MQIFFSSRQLAHDPAQELQNGALVPYAETPARARSVSAALDGAAAPDDHGLAPVLRVHDAAYVAFLERAHRDWRAAGRSGDAFPYVFPIRRRAPATFSRIDAELGYHAYDCGTPVAEGTYPSAYWSVQTALSAFGALASGARAAFAQCRPPGHHAGADYMGGYCYLNNAAIVAQRALDLGAGRVALLDVDYHHGNGTQDIFYARGEALTVSIHADPATDYPFYWGRAEETGEGRGAGANLNLPLPRGTDWTMYRAALARAIDRVDAFGPDLLIVPFGADTFAGDPISAFRLQTEDYTAMARMIAALARPTLIILEGGYAVSALGANVAAFLAGFDAPSVGS
jgi:acetoin utilization deacetylase AcuC-like enzyme